MQTEWNALVVFARGEASKAWLNRRGFFSSSTKLTYLLDSFSDVVNLEISRQGRRGDAIVETPSDGRRLDNRLISVPEWFKRPIEEASEKDLGLPRIRCPKLNMRRFSAHLDHP